MAQTWFRDAFKPKMNVCFVNFEGLMFLSELYQSKVISLLGWINLLVTAVPVPLVSRLDRKEVSGALVLHFLGES